MSLFDDIAHALGHTVETLALDVGTDVYELESVVNDLAGNGIDVFSIGDRFGLSTAGFLRSIVNILRGDPHEQLLGYITGPFKPVYAMVEGLAAQWGQMAQFHQETAQMLNLHISEVLHGDGTFSYSGPAAETLWNTHLDYLSSLNTMVEHAQTQQRRYAVLGGHFGDFLGQAPGKVYGLSAPMAALAVLSVETSTPVLDQPIVQETEQGIEALWGDEESIPPSPLSVVILVLIALLALFLLLVIIFYWIKSAVDDHNHQQKNTTVPSVKHKAVPTVTSGSGHSQPVNLTDAQKRLLNDVKSRLGIGPYDDKEIEALILAGYLDPNAIAAMIKDGSATIFTSSDIAKMMNTLTDAQQLKLLNIVEQYQKTHPDLTTHQVYNYLRYTKMKAQLANLDANITGNDPTDPVSQAIVGLFPSRAIDLKKRLDQKVGANFGTVTDPFTVTDVKLDGWYANLTGVWGEWAAIKQYYQQGKLVDYSIPISGGEVDIKIKEDNGTGSLVTKWVEVKNVQSLKNAWSTALDQVKKYITVDHATSVIIELPQQGIRGNSGPSRQQQQRLQDLERQYPSVQFEVRMGSSDPRLQIPFDPPATNWGAYLP